MNGGGTEVAEEGELLSIPSTRVPPRPLEWTSRTHLGRIMKPPVPQLIHLYSGLKDISYTEQQLYMGLVFLSLIE